MTKKVFFLGKIGYPPQLKGPTFFLIRALLIVNPALALRLYFTLYIPNVAFLTVVLIHGANSNLS